MLFLQNSCLKEKGQKKTLVKLPWTNPTQGISSSHTPKVVSVFPVWGLLTASVLCNHFMLLCPSHAQDRTVMYVSFTSPDATQPTHFKF